jgi:hypothetical protein
MFPGRAPILQWGIKKGDAQSFSVREERTTPPRRGGGAHGEGTRGEEHSDGGARAEEDGSACSRARGAVLSSRQHVPAPRGSLGWAGAREREAEWAGQCSADDRPPTGGQRHRHATWPHPVQAARDKQVPEPTTRIRFEDVVLPHLHAAYNLARWLTRNDQDAEDVMQEAYVRAWKFSHSPGFSGRRSASEGEGRSRLDFPLVHDVQPS